MFESVWETCLELIANTRGVEKNPLQRDRACHDAFISSLSSIFIGREQLLQKLSPENSQCKLFIYFQIVKCVNYSSILIYQILVKIKLVPTNFSVLYNLSK